MHRFRRASFRCSRQNGPTPNQASKLTSSSLTVVRKLDFIGLPPRENTRRRTAGIGCAPEETRSPTSDQTEILKEILTEVKKTNEEVDKVKASLSDMDKRLANVEQREAEVSSSACSSSERQKMKVPNKIRVM